MGREGEVQAEGSAKQTHDSGFSLWDSAVSGLEHISGISTIKAICKSESVSNMLDDFRLIDDGKSGFTEEARKHVEKSLNGEQRRHLEEERDSYRNRLIMSGLPVFFAPDAPEKGPLMKQLDNRAHEIVKAAEKNVEQNMTSDEMKQYLDEKKAYETSQVAMATIAGIGLARIPQPGPMMKEYEKRVHEAIKNQGANWEEPSNNN